MMLSNRLYDYNAGPTMPVGSRQEYSRVRCLGLHWLIYKRRHCSEDAFGDLENCKIFAFHLGAIIASRLYRRLQHIPRDKVKADYRPVDDELLGVVA
jgi:hypothetical protein